MDRIRHCIDASRSEVKVADSNGFNEAVPSNMLRSKRRRVHVLSIEAGRGSHRFFIRFHSELCPWLQSRMEDEDPNLDGLPELGNNNTVSLFVVKKRKDTNLPRLCHTTQ